MDINQSEAMRYKGYTVTVSVSWPAGARGHPRYAILTGGAIVHQDVLRGEFEDDLAAEDAAYRAAREWIDAKCQVN